MITLVYYTDNQLDPLLDVIVRRELIRAAQGKRIVSVSKKPIKFGDNICVGDSPRNHLWLYKQMGAGIESARTKFIALAEHDCLYTPEHFNWIPPDERVFYYNINHWFVRFSDGRYSYFRRRPLSQLICGRDIALTAVREKIWMLEHGWMIKKGLAGACEPGVLPSEECMVKVPPEHMMEPDPYWLQKKVDSLPCEPGIAERKAEYIAALQDFKDLGKEIGRYQAKGFATINPNLDIRHDHNFSGGRRGKNETYELPYWGKFKDVVKYGPLYTHSIEERGIRGINNSRYNQEQTG